MADICWLVKGWVWYVLEHPGQLRLRTTTLKVGLLSLTHNLKGPGSVQALSLVSRQRSPLQEELPQYRSRRIGRDWLGLGEVSGTQDFPFANLVGSDIPRLSTSFHVPKRSTGTKFLSAEG
jgi:hypothetical protein